MRYDEFRPGPALAPFVRCYWVLEASAAGAPAAGAPERVVPDGCAELIIHFGDRFHPIHDPADGPPAARGLQPRSTVVGQITRAIELYPSGSIGVLGVRFRPAGARAFVPAPMHELLRRSEPLEAFWGRDVALLEERVLAATTAAERVRAVEDALLGRLTAARSRRAAVDHAVDALVATGGLATIDAVAADAGVSGRQLERAFRSAVGIPPKLLARILRFQAVFHRMEESLPAGWAAVAIDCGYYDQSHLTRDFRAFAGEPPASYFAREHPLADLFTRRSAAAALDVAFVQDRDRGPAEDGTQRGRLPASATRRRDDP